MLSDSEIKEKVFEMGAEPLTPTSHLFPEYGAISILEAARKNAPNYTKLGKERPAVKLIEVILAANRNYNKVVRPRVDQITKETDLTSFDQLIEKMRSISMEEFYLFWGHKDHKKYIVLKEIMNRIPLLRLKYQTAISDYELMNHWANDVVLSNYRKDIIGEIKFIAIATIQHLRMSFGCDTVKPDQRVKEVLHKLLSYPKLSDMKVIQAVEHISDLTGLSSLVIDQIFVNYGSGYYNISEKGLPVMEIARRLKRFNVPEEVISEATLLPMTIVRSL